MNAQLVDAMMAVYRVDEQTLYTAAVIAERNRVKQLNTVRDRLDALVHAAKRVRNDFLFKGAVTPDGWMELAEAIREAEGEGSIMKPYETPKLEHHGKLRMVTQFSSATITSTPAPDPPATTTAPDPPAPHAYITSD